MVKCIHVSNKDTCYNDYIYNEISIRLMVMDVNKYNHNILFRDDCQINLIVHEYTVHVSILFSMTLYMG